MGANQSRTGDTRHDDERALEEIRRLFARYRQTARHGRVTERDESAQAPTEEAKQATIRSGR